MNRYLKIIFGLITLLIVMVLSGNPSAVKKYRLREVIEPSSINLDEQYIYIPQQTSIFIYRYNSRGIIFHQQIGKTGEGPQEFLLNVAGGHEELILDLQTSHLIVNSMGKISLFGRKNNFPYLGEIKSRSRSNHYLPMGNGYVGQGMAVDKGIQYRSINLYDGELNKTREVFKVRHHFQLNEGLRVFDAAYRYATDKNKLFVAWEPDFIIRVYDTRGKELYKIEQDYERIKPDDNFKSKVTQYLKTSKKYKPLFELLKIKVLFPRQLPAINNLLIDRGRIYALTHGTRDEQTECFVFNNHGTLLRRAYLPIHKDPDTEGFLPYPYTIFQDKMYQLVNIKEQWFLTIHKI